MIGRSVISVLFTTIENRKIIQDFLFFEKGVRVCEESTNTLAGASSANVFGNAKPVQLFSLEHKLGCTRRLRRNVILNFTNRMLAHVKAKQKVNSHRTQQMPHRVPLDQ